MSDSVPETETPEKTAQDTRGDTVQQTGPETARARPEYAPAAPAPLHVPRTSTGNADVDARLERLGDADHLGTDGHVEVYEDVHEGLRDALTALDARPGPPGPTRHPTTTPQRGPSGHEPYPPYGNRS